jgi:uncharacterized membrane-anchored protein YhcB (DUF1043 family)
MMWMIKNWRIVSLGLMALITVGMVFGAYLKGDANGYSRAIAQLNLEKAETINENIRIIEKALDYNNRTNAAYRQWLQSQAD